MSFLSSTSLRTVTRIIPWFAEVRSGRFRSNIGVRERRYPQNVYELTFYCDPGSNFIYLMSFVMFLLPKRHWILYPVIIAMNWWTYNYNFMFFLGLLLADLEINGIWGRVRAWPWYVVLPLEIGLLAIAGVFLWVPQVALNVDYGVLPVQLYHGTLGAQASWHGISTSLWVSATLVLVWAEICSWGQIALEFWPFAFLGKVGASVLVVLEL